MFRVLIVEDEMLVRLGLKNSIEWSKFDMAVIADAADGQTAWEIYQKEKPDLIITDLKMPVMGGMELITKIRENDKKTKIIILSCLEEFDLVRKAMAFGVSNYSLKLTMTEEEMEAILSKVHEEMKGQKNKNKASLSVDSLSKDVVKEKFLKDYLFYNIYSVNEFTAFISEAGLRMNSGRQIMCIMEIDHFETLKNKFNDGKGQLIKSAILNILDEILCSYSRGEAFSDSDLNYILVFSFHEITSEQEVYKELYTILNNIKSSLSTFLNVYVSFGISSLNNGYNSMPKMYKEALKALENKYFLGSGIYLSQSNSDFGKIAVEKIEKLRSQAKIVKNIGDSGIRDFNSKIDSFIQSNPNSKEQMQMFYSRMLQYLPSQMYPIDDNNSILVIKYNEKIQKSETLDEVIDNFDKFVSELTDKSMKKEILSKEVAEALKFIQIHYGQDISLPQVAGHVKLSANYLGNLFKKELKINFIEYLNELRIGKAKELLVGTYLKSYEVAERVGFTEHTYFSKVFKKIVGSSPNEFRKSLMKEWSEDMENEDNEEV